MTLYIVSRGVGLFLHCGKLSLLRLFIGHNFRIWRGHSFRNSQLVRHIPKHRGSRQYFICAVPKMMEQVERALHELDVPVTHVHMEHFNLA